MMTVAEHDRLWMGGAQSIINCETKLENIHRDLKRRNAIEICKELYKVGAYTDEEYKEQLMKLLENEGYTWKE